MIDNNATVNARAKNGAIPLHYAALKRKPGHLEAAKILLENGAEVNAANADGVTPLMMASFSRNTAMINLLREYGAEGQTQLTMEQRRKLMFQMSNMGMTGKR